MNIFSLLTMIGGLALFLYGMNTMGEGLVMLSGGKLERILEKLTEKRSMALLLGTLVTAVIQSSSATTVMVVGFVNSGIMKLNQAVGIIMGANIGTTVTSWILSLTGISSSNVVLKLLKPSSFSPILAAVGMICIMTGKDEDRRKTIGNILTGFAVLMFGMETMSGSVAPLKDSTAFTGILTSFSNPVLGIAAGAFLTAVIQSSSASVGILQALCISGAVSYASALPIIMGQNIGTCVTALISSVGASRNARRAAFIHLYFNLIGTVLFVVCFYTMNYFHPFAFLAHQATAAGIAVIHSLFNIGCALVLFPFADQIVKLAALTVRTRKQDMQSEQLPEELAALDARFLDSPAFAVQLSRQAVERMASDAVSSIHLALEVLHSYDSEKAAEVHRLEQRVDLFEDTVSSFLVRAAGRDLNREDSHTLSVLLYSISDFERISDHAVSMVETAGKMQKAGLTFTEQGKQELEALCRASEEIISLCESAFIADDTVRAAQAEPLKEVIHDLVVELKRRHILRLRSGECSLESGLLLEDILTDCGRVADHCSNIAAAMIEVQADELDTHRYGKGNMAGFQEEYRKQKQMYLLP